MLYALQLNPPSRPGNKAGPEVRGRRAVFTLCRGPDQMEDLGTPAVWVGLKELDVLAAVVTLSVYAY